LKVDWDLVKSQDVRLADGKVLKTCGKVELDILFGSFAYNGTFFVL
jgi:hypothetical protein